MSILKPRSGNLLQNASFEAGLYFWQAENAGIANSSPAEGTQVAGLFAGVGSLYQIAPISPFLRRPLFLSFIAYAPEPAGSGSLTAEVLWLDSEFNVAGTGLRAVIPGSAITNARITFFDVTDTPPVGAVWAKLLFSKGQSDLQVYLDLINLTPVKTANLIQNPSFEYGLDNWAATGFVPGFSPVLEGGAAAASDLLSSSGSLIQTVSLRPVFPGAVYLLSFAFLSDVFPAQVFVRWLNILGEPIGDPAIDVEVSPVTLAQQGNYLNIVQLTDKSPAGTAAASIELGYSNNAAAAAALDQVLFIRLDSPNLLLNPGFAAGLDEWTSEGAAIVGTGAYVGANYAGLSADGAFIHQTVELPVLAISGSFLFNFALRFGGADAANGSVLAQVHWLDRNGLEIGLAASLNVAQTVQTREQWQVYTAFTEKPPISAAYARIQFTKSQGAALTDIGLDSVTFAKVT